MAETITRHGAVLPVEVRTARKRHACNDCRVPIDPGDKYELCAFPPHSIPEYDTDRWIIWRNHYPRRDGDRFLAGCADAADRKESVRNG